MKFPSPIYGASFKLDDVIDGNYDDELMFPSPIYGASFKLSCYQGFRKRGY